MGALLTLLVNDFNTPIPFLPNRRTKNQKIEQSVTDSDVGRPSGCPVSPEAMGKALPQMTSIIVSYPQRTNKTRPIHLQLKPEPQPPTPTGQPEAEPNLTPEPLSAVANQSIAADSPDA
jgi:hypothetical protein